MKLSQIIDRNNTIAKILGPRYRRFSYKNLTSDQRLQVLKDILQKAKRRPEIAAKFGYKVDDIEKELRDEMNRRRELSKLDPATYDFWGNW
jgi:hypothetical protein